MNRVLRSLWGPLWAGVAAALVAGGAAAASADEPVARVVAVRGSATAQSPGEEPRPLRCNDPLHAGDRIATEPGASVSLLAGDVYAGLDARTVATVDGAADRPRLAVERGHLRVLDAGGRTPVRLETPGLAAADAGADVEALVFPEKAWTVSMLCAYDESLAVTRPSGEGARPEAGSCAVSKPGEPLFVADASHPRLAVVADACPLDLELAGLPAGRFGSPADVALGPDVAAGPLTSLAPAIAAAGGGALRNPCEVGVSCSGPAAGTGSPFPPVGPPPLP